MFKKKHCNETQNTVISIEHEFIDDKVANELNEFIKNMNKEVISVIVNVDKVNFIVSAGIGAIIKIYTDLKRNGKDFKMINVSEHMKKIFAITKIDQIIPLEYKE